MNNNNAQWGNSAFTLTISGQEFLKHPERVVQIPPFPPHVLLLQYISAESGPNNKPMEYKDLQRAVQNELNESLHWLQIMRYIKEI